MVLKKGFLFTIDSIIGASIIITGILLIVLSALSLFQVITKDQEALIMEYAGVIVEALSLIHI